MMNTFGKTARCGGFENDNKQRKAVSRDHAVLANTIFEEEDELQSMQSNNESTNDKGNWQSSFDAGFDTDFYVSPVPAVKNEFVVPNQLSTSLTRSIRNKRHRSATSSSSIPNFADAELEPQFLDDVLLLLDSIEKERYSGLSYSENQAVSNNWNQNPPLYNNNFGSSNSYVNPPRYSHQRLFVEESPRPALTEITNFPQPQPTHKRTKNQPNTATTQIYSYSVPSSSFPTSTHDNAFNISGNNNNHSVSNFQNTSNTNYEQPYVEDNTNMMNQNTEHSPFVYDPFFDELDIDILCNIKTEQSQSNFTPAIPATKPVINDTEPLQPFPVLPELNQPIQSKRTNSEGSISPEKSSLKFWEVPESICESYKAKGVTGLYDWQVQCLESSVKIPTKPGSEENKEATVWVHRANLVYSAPTSGGKTLVAELLMLRTILHLKKKALFVLPFVSVVVEKTQYLNSVFSSMNIHTKALYAGHSVPAWEKESIDIYVCTIEKANGLVNRWIEMNQLAEVGIVVIDEIHMMSDRDRGYLLELMVTKLLYKSANDIQIIGLSATLPNIDHFQKWLNASLYISYYRPVPLNEYVKVGSIVYDKDWTPVRSVETAALTRFKDHVKSINDPDNLIYLCLETVTIGGSVLVFCATKRQCERTAEFIAETIHPLNHSPQLEEKRATLVEELRRTIAGLDPVLEKSVRKGVAFHHAGLTVEERTLVEVAFRQNTLNVLLATSTLAAGVNLPARRVIFRSPYVGLDFLDITRYKQMAGRAGRTGIDTFGESVILCKPNEQQAVKELLIQNTLQPLESCFHESKRGMYRPLLEGIATELIQSVHDIEKFIKCTLFNAQRPYAQVHKVTKSALSYLQEHELLEWLPHQQTFTATKFGRACVASSLSPDESLIVFKELRKARQMFILDCELHLVYELTPVFHGIEPNWIKYYEAYSTLGLQCRQVADLVGVSPVFLSKSSANPPGYQSADHSAALHRRFYAALILYDLVNEVPFWKLEEKYDVSRGSLQQLQTSSFTFAGMVHAFVNKLGWWDMEALIGHFMDRLNFGVQMELLPLMQIQNIKAYKARLLYKAGFKTVASVAHASPEQIELVLRNAAPFKSAKQADPYELSSLQSARRVEARMARLIVASAQQIAGVDPNNPQSPLKSSPSSSSPSPPSGNRPQTSPARSPIKSTGHPAHRSHPSPVKMNPNLIKPRKIPHTLLGKSKVPNQELGVEVVHISAARGPIGMQPNPHLTGLAATDVLFKEFYKSWEKRLEYSFALHYSEHIPDVQNNPILKANSKLGIGTKSLVSIEGISVCWKKDVVYYVEWCPGRAEAIETILSNDNTHKICYDIKNPIRALLELGIQVKGHLEDPHIAGWLLDPKDESVESYSMEKLYSQYLPNTANAVSNNNNLVNNGNLNEQSNASPWQKTCKMAIQSLELMKKLGENLKSELLYDAFINIEMPLVPLLASMEFYGIGFDPKICTAHHEIIQKKLNQLEQSAFQYAGKTFSLGSGKDVSHVLYEILKLPRGRDKTRMHHNRHALTHVYDTSAQYLNTIKHLHPVVSIIVEYRRLQALIERYIHLLPKYALYNTHLNLIRIHACTMQTNSATGRMIVVNPSLQTIPHKRVFDDAMVHEDPHEVTVTLRESFHSCPGWVLMTADYSQIELRIMAHYSQDSILLPIFRNGKDVFNQIASQWLGKSEQDISKSERDYCKQICYGLLYGMGPRSLYEVLALDSVDTARSYIDSFKQRFQGVTKFLDQVIEDCRKTGYVTTVCGRRRYIPDINHPNEERRSAAERMATNSLCQGSAADILKKAMIQIQARIMSWKSLQYLPGNSRSHSDGAKHLDCPRLVLQVHDELMFEVPQSDVNTIQRIIREEMESALTLNVPLQVMIHVGTHWGTLAPFDPLKN